MKALLYIFLFSLPFIGIAQNDTLIINNNYKWKIGVKGIYERSDGGSEPNHVFNNGVQVIYKMGKKWSSIESGIYFYKRTQSLVFKYTSYTYDYFNYELNNIHFPLKYRLQLRFFYLTLGIYGEYVMSRTMEIPDNVNITFIERPNGRHFLAGFISSVGLEKKVSSKNIYLFLEIGGSLNFTTIYRHETLFGGGTSFTTRNYGLSIGVNYRVSKK